MIKGVITIREKIIFACSELARLKGFYKVSVDEIAAQAGLSKRTIYRYFSSKDEIIEAVIDYYLDQVGQEMEKIVATKQFPEEAFACILDVFYRIGRHFINPMVMQDLRQHYPHYWEKIDNFRMARAQVIIKAFLEQSDKETIRIINPKIATTIVLTTIQAVLNPEYIMSNNLTFQETAEQVINFLKYGFFKKEDTDN